MLEIKKQLADLLTRELGAEVKLTDFTVPPNIELGDLALPCFNFSKAMKLSPQEIAQQVTGKLITWNATHGAGAEFIESVLATGPYVNIKLQPEFLNGAVLKGNKETKNIAKGKVMVEYSQPNTHKEFHVGHLRNVCLGAFLVNILRNQGQEVVAANYIGDTGVHVAKCLWNFTKNHAGDDIPANKGQYLGEIYAEASAMLETNEEFKAEVSDIQHKLEKGDQELTKIWQETKDWSLESFYRIYDLLGVKFDEWFWESEEEASGRKMIEEILEGGFGKLSLTNNAIKKSEGAIIADLREYGLEVLVLIKSDGNVLYGAKDLPLAIKKFEKYGIDKSMYVVDVRQSLYLKQIFKLLDLMGYEKREKVHIPFDFVTTPAGAMASRKGNVITFDDVYNQAFSAANLETAKRHEDWATDKIDMVASRIALAALKFWMLKYDTKSVIVFDLDKALAIEGSTGPYLLYTIARINSILKQATLNEKAKVELLVESAERKLILKIGAFEELLAEAAAEYSSVKVCVYLLELAQDFNNFYHQCPVLKAEPKLREARLVLANKTKQVLENGLAILNIQSVEEM